MYPVRLNAFPPLLEGSNFSIARMGGSELGSRKKDQNEAIYFDLRTEIGDIARIGENAQVCANIQERND